MSLAYSQSNQKSDFVNIFPADLLAPLETPKINTNTIDNALPFNYILDNGQKGKEPGTSWYGDA
jgi:hypothetical protein